MCPTFADDLQSAIRRDLTLNLCDEKIADSGDIEGIETKFLDVSFGISVFLIQEFQEVIHIFSLSDYS